MNRLPFCLLFGALLVAGCATMDVITGQALPVAPGQTQADALTQLANNQIIAAVLDDAAATRVWVAAQQAKGMDPVKVQLALACPTAAEYAAKDFHDKVLQLKASLDQLGAKIEDVDASKPRLMLRLTQLKYGSEFDLRAQIAQVRDDINLRLDALFTGCAHLFPKKQLVNLASLAAKAGLISTGAGGVAAMFLP
jgi:hypothetical protein